ncbi:RWD domain-containing protein isoform X2 [Wolffia australiana]
MEEEEEVQAELEAVVAVYGDDCRALKKFPPHIHVFLKPRTADDSAKQFVEAVLGVRAGPLVYYSMGLDEERREKLVFLLRNKGLELSSRPMLIALCEEAVDILAGMNHPEGNCPLCLDPLFQIDANNKLLPFMKLMSCFHCFHSECILRWWKWVQQEREKDAKNPPQRTRPLFEDQRDVQISTHMHQANCPVCRKVFTLTDLEHILAMIEINALESSSLEVDGEALCFELINSEAEIRRRENFDGLLRIQQMNDGLIEPKKDLIVVPGMFLPEQLTLAPATDDTSSGVSSGNGNEGDGSRRGGNDGNNGGNGTCSSGNGGSSVGNGGGSSSRKGVNAASNDGDGSCSGGNGGRNVGDGSGSTIGSRNRSGGGGISSRMSGRRCSGVERKVIRPHSSGGIKNGDDCRDMTGSGSSSNSSRIGGGRGRSSGSKVIWSATTNVVRGGDSGSDGSSYAGNRGDGSCVDRGSNEGNCHGSRISGGGNRRTSGGRDSRTVSKVIRSVAEAAEAGKLSASRTTDRRSGCGQSSGRQRVKKDRDYEKDFG